MREKLIELLKDTHGNAVWHHWGYEESADHLIANGVTLDNQIASSSKQVASSEWISVKDRLPEDASTVLAIDSDGTISSAYYVGRWHSGGDLDEDAVTYWMPLPTAPNEDEQ